MSYQTLYDKLLAYCETDAYPFHMPGHKRRLGSMADPFSIDITEIEGFDNLHHAEGVLLEAQARAAKLYGARQAFYLVNGSTAGILAALSAALRAPRDPEPEILFARNAHKAAYHALYLNRARPVWLTPESPGEGMEMLNGRISPEQVREKLEAHPDARAVFLTSPTYDGMVSDIRAIAELAHERQIPLVVDQAHGAHYGLYPGLPENAIALGADLVIMSLHKTLPSLTQTGLLLLGGDLLSPEQLVRQLAVFQTSSPSYVLMAGIDRCVCMMEEQRESLFGCLLEELVWFRREAQGLQNVRLIETDDPTRILVTAMPRLSGRAICDILRERFHIETEMDLPGYVLCLVGAGDTHEGFARLLEALRYIDRKLEAETAGGEAGDGAGSDDSVGDRTGTDGNARGKARDNAGDSAGDRAARLQGEIARIVAREPETVCSIYEAWDDACESIPVDRCAGRVSGDFAYLYPPGMPLVIPGERIDADAARLLTEAPKAGFGLSGMADLSGRYIRVLPEDR